MEAEDWKSYYKDVYGSAWLSASKEYARENQLWVYHGILTNLVGVKPGEVVLDCGIGTGIPFALTFAKLGAVMHGVDISPRLIHECLANFKNEGLVINCQVGDLEDLPYSDEVFDVVYSMNTTWYVPDLKRALTEMRRVTKPGGKIVFDVINLLHPSQFLSYQYCKFGQTRLYAIDVPTKSKSAIPSSACLPAGTLLP